MSADPRPDGADRHERWADPVDDVRPAPGRHARPEPPAPPRTRTPVRRPAFAPHPEPFPLRDGADTSPPGPPRPHRRPRRSRLRIVLAAVVTLALVAAVVGWLHGARTTSGTAVGGRPVAGVGAPAAAAAASSAAASRSASATALPDRLDALLGGGGDTWSVGVLDVTTGTSTTLGASSGMSTGSIMKVLLLETLLRTEGGVDGLSSDERDSASAMITESDNDAALAVWNDAGGDDALDGTASMLGLTDTHIAPDGYFGASTTSAADQIKVLKELVQPTFLTSDDADYARQLMTDVEADQRWGVPTVADAGTTAMNKNGWLNNDDDDELWLVDSIGIVTVRGDELLVAVLTQHQPDFDTGVDRINQATADVVAALAP